MKYSVVQLKTMFLLVMLFSVAGVLVIGCAPATNPEPRYNERTLSEWLVEYEAGEVSGGTRDTNAITAICTIGSNAAPFLVKWINVADYTPTERVRDLIGFGLGHPYTPPRLARANRAMRAFQLLGTNAAPAIPDLTKIILEDKRYEAGIDAREALVYIGPPGVIALSMLATNRSTPHRFETITTLGLSAETGPRDMAKPYLTNCLSDPDPQVRYGAGCALAEIAREDESRAKVK